MEIIFAVIPVAMLSFYAGLAFGSVSGTTGAFKDGVRFGRHLEKRRLRSYRNLGMFRPECEHMIDTDYQETESESE
ncbi:hypothetical protein [Motiliproteus sp. MSK22-1]|uniref:hypothetical protein n=1 Tax=Motiliproteus sp. MSK22-1 TaxID=1897630 RepID=UPI000976A788|nr:hypothetical protein [Motiliproteus sp. MSK22-1]OMH39251.1 hypothetical protein BGP75_03920 [Motiliproteus sp. MSK22-1]